MNDFIVTYLDSIDKKLLAYLDDQEELRRDIVRRMRFYVTALLDGSITPAALDEDWPDFFDLVPAFVATYTPELAELEEAAGLLAADIDHETQLTGSDRAYLTALEERLDMYPETRDISE